MYLNLSNLDSRYVTEVYKPNLAAGEKCTEKASWSFFVLAVEARGRYYFSVCQAVVHEAMATPGPLNSWEGLSLPCILTGMFQQVKKGSLVTRT